MLLVVGTYAPELLREIETRYGSRAVHLASADLQRLGPLLPQVQVLLLRSEPTLNAALLDQMPGLRAVIRAGVGLDHIDQPELERRGIRLYNCQGANAQSVGEHALGMLLALLNHLPRADRQVRAGLWYRAANRGHELAGRAVGIIGYGHTGQAFARVLQGFGCRVLAYDKYRTQYSDAFATEATLEEILLRAEVVSFHVPLADDTHHYFDHQFLARLNYPIWLLNLSRGEVVDLQAVLDGLKAGKLRGAALDVLENEDLQSLTPQQRFLFDALAEREDTLFSPHIGGWTWESEARISAIVAAAIATEMPPAP
jgi:D-3-phosphoglycerate dehydrogenase